MNKYKIRLWHDKQYAVYTLGSNSDPLFVGTTVEVHAWISLKEKGYDI